MAMQEIANTHKITKSSDAPWSNRPVKVDNDQIKTLLKNNQLHNVAGDGQQAQNIQIRRWKSFQPAW